MSSMMRIERWYWLLYFCAISLALHVVAVLRSRTFAYPIALPTPTHQIEVALEPPAEPKPAAPKPPAKKSAARTVRTPSPRIAAQRPQRVVRVHATAPRRIAMARVFRVPHMAPPAPRTEVRAAEPPKEAVKVAANNTVPGGPNPLPGEKLEPLGVPYTRSGQGVPRLRRIARAMPMPMAGGSPAPGVVLGGHGGAPGPEAPPQDVLWNGGGSGGADLPREAPRLGGGGGRSILSVENPLAHEAIPEDRPGIGPGTGGGEGAGSGGGAGFWRGAGIGTRPGGRYDLATLHAGSGQGIGGGKGSGLGTRAPGGGRGTGSELPGTGGLGSGYGRGEGSGFGTRPTRSHLLIAENPLARETALHERPGYDTGVDEGGAGRYAIAGLGGRPGPGLGRGIGSGIGNGTPGGRRRAAPEVPGGGGGGLGNGSGPGSGMGTRQVAAAPHNPEHVADVLRSAGRGAIFGVRPRTTTVNDGPLHIVYVLDLSDSMHEQDKIGKARRALQHALSELELRDTFNIVTFASQVHTFRPTMVQANNQNIAAAKEWAESFETGIETNLSGGLKAALGMNGITHVVLLTDGEPTIGIRNKEQLRAAVKRWNTQHAQIIALALVLREHEMNSDLLRALAEDNGGTFSEINLATHRGR
ncbi:MAG: vWA domain-containing protein [Chthonomonadales bacterium]